MDSIITAYKQSNRRLLLLDYDGTLVDFTLNPAEAAPPDTVREVLRELGSDPRNMIVVISGRDCHKLESWLGELPLSLVAEHGFLIKESGKSWQQTAEVNESWKATIRPIMEASVKIVPGSFVEDKAVSLVWHYRKATAQSGTAEAEKLQHNLLELVTSLGLQLLPGSKIVEVRQRGIDKGMVAQRWLAKSEWSFILAAGDDTTDEDLFRALPPKAFTIKIGLGATHAQHQLRNCGVLLRLLHQFIT